MDSRAKEGIVLGYGRQRHSYIIFSNGTVDEYRAIRRLPLSRRWDAAKLQEVNVTPKDLHGGRGSRAVPFTNREAGAAEPPPQHAAQLVASSSGRQTLTQP